MSPTAKTTLKKLIAAGQWPNFNQAVGDLVDAFCDSWVSADENAHQQFHTLLKHLTHRCLMLITILRTEIPQLAVLD